MTNEVLISTVRYKGQTVGSANLTIEDTSAYAKYTFALNDVNKGGNFSPDQLMQLGKYKFALTGSSKVQGVDNIYCRLTTTDGKLNSPTAYLDTSPILVKEFSLPISQTGTAEYILDTNFFPSILGYTGILEFFHDSNHLFLFKSYSLTVIPLTKASLEVISKRRFNSRNDTLILNATEMGEEFVVALTYSNEVGFNTPKTVNVGYKGLVGNTAFGSTNQWLNWETGKNTIDIIKQTGTTTSSTVVKTIAYPATKTKQLIEVTMGELTDSNVLQIKNFIYQYAWRNKTNGKEVPIFQQGYPIADYVTMTAQGSSTGVDPNNRLGPVSRVNNPDSVRRPVFKANIPLYGANDPVGYRKPYTGQLTALAWVPSALQTLQNRMQFGKFQKSFVMEIDNLDVASMTLNWAKISDPIADAEYGVPSTLIGSDIVVLASAVDRADMNNTLFNTNAGLQDFYIRPVSYSPEGNGERYKGPMNVLVLRKSEMLDTYPDWVPYPRIIKANWAFPIADGSWKVTIPDTPGIDLREERYQLQFQVEQTPQDGGNVTYSWQNSIVTREKNTLSVASSYTNRLPDPKHYAIWDLGPNAVISEGEEETLHGDLKTTATNVFSTSEITGNYTNTDSALMFLKTVGDNTVNDYYGGSTINTKGTKEFTGGDFVPGSSVIGYNGPTGLLVWNTKQMATVDQRLQFASYIKSLSKQVTTQPNGNYNVEIKPTDLVDGLSEAIYGKVEALSNENVLTFAGLNKASVNFDTLAYTGTSLVTGIKVEAGGANSNVKVNYLFLNKGGWMVTRNETIYPRIVYADILESVNGVTYTLPVINLTDPMDDRYQVMTMLRPATNGAPVQWTPTALKKGSINYVFTNRDPKPGVRLQVAIVDYGPSTILMGQASPVQTAIGVQLTKLLPMNEKASNPDLSFSPSIGRAFIGSGSSGYHLSSLTNFGINRSNTDNSVESWAQGRNLYPTWGGARQSARGAIAWYRNRRISETMKKQVPNLVARSYSTAGVNVTGFTWDSLKGDISVTGKTVTNLNDASLVIVPVPQSGGLTFKFVIDGVGQTLTYKDSSTNTAFNLTDSNEVSTLIVKETKVMPTFDESVPYPRVIFATRSTPTVAYDTAQFVTKLEDPSYDNVDIGSGRYQFVWAMESKAGDSGYNAFDDSNSNNRTWFCQAAGWIRYGSNCIKHVILLDFGPDFDK